jgi:hypothetical protein
MGNFKNLIKLVIMEGVVAEVLKVEPSDLAVEKNIKLMRGFFPENSLISSLGNKEYQVNGILEDSPFCEGGQKIEMRLFMLGKSQPDEVKLEKGWVVDPYLVLKILDFSVNGENVNDERFNLILNGNDGWRNTITGEKTQKKSDEFNICTSNMEKDFAYVRIGEAHFGGIKTGDGLAAYFHEIGHLDRIEGDLFDWEHDLSRETFISRLTDMKSLSDFKIDDQIEHPESDELYRKVVYEERQASLKALRFLGEHQNIFPNDQTLSRVKQFYGNRLSSYMRFQSGFTRDEVVTVMDFDQDWHY